jgi:hypothetical protein
MLFGHPKLFEAHAIAPTAPTSDGEAAIRAAGLAVNHLNPTGEAEIRRAIPLARAAALAVKSRSDSTGWRVGEFTGLPIALFQNWLYEKNRSWRFTDGTLCILWCAEFPHSRSDYAKNHDYIQSTRRDGRHFDAFVNGHPLRVVVVEQEYGNGPARVTLSHRYQDVVVRTGLQKHFRRTGAIEGRILTCGHAFAVTPHLRARSRRASRRRVLPYAPWRCASVRHVRAGEFPTLLGDCGWRVRTRVQARSVDTNNAGELL